MDDMRREALQAALDEAEAERNQLDSVIRYLRGKLGHEGSATPDANKPPTASVGLSTGDPSSIIGEGEFYGQSGPKAARQVLERVGRTRPLKTEEIFAAIKKGGVQISSAEVLYRSMFRDHTFHRVGRGRWGLRAWYPNAPARRKGTEGSDGEVTVDAGASVVVGGDSEAKAEE
jgi:HB1, ASXL, restriction endonuclease HTH domain